MSNKMKLVSSDDLKAQTVAAYDRLNELRLEQVAALEEGREFHHNGEILLVTERIEALNEAVSRAERREDEEREHRIRQLERQRLEHIRAKVTTVREKRDQALSEVEAKMHDAMSAITSFLEASRHLEDLGLKAKPTFDRHGLNVSEPGILHVGNAKMRLGTYLSAALQTLSVGTNHLGQLSWETNPDMRRDWAAREHQATAEIDGVLLRDIDRLLNILPGATDEAP
ncbi:hypothetical protein O9X80_05435 [Agrobacterium salinitolerans]|uniref:hypothetical protein n=1 Tax=Agrobacterium salinitolerans TaxID=1183413 RepID=UPI0022B83095|nr:hypothetical protein [Agrobacterium salinitolerans]MCZ7973934.1 hypothetical protein [Agrobacterium salinitolerans]